MNSTLSQAERTGNYNVCGFWFRVWISRPDNGLTAASRLSLGDLVRASGCPHPDGLKMRWVEGEYFASIAAGRIGRAAKLPPQLGHRPPRRAPRIRDRTCIQRCRSSRRSPRAANSCTAFAVGSEFQHRSLLARECPLSHHKLNRPRVPGRSGEPIFGSLHNTIPLFNGTCRCISTGEGIEQIIVPQKTRWAFRSNLKSVDLKLGFSSLSIFYREQTNRSLNHEIPK